MQAMMISNLPPHHEHSWCCCLEPQLAAADGPNTAAPHNHNKQDLREWHTPWWYASLQNAQLLLHAHNKWEEET
jgi:hypothetical protein